MELKTVLMIIAPKDFRDEEFLEPKKVFERKGFNIVVASKGVSEAEGKLGHKALVDINIDDAKIDDYDAVVFVGGGGAAAYFKDSTAINIAKSAYEKGKTVAAICIAPSILANAGILEGKKATCFASEKENLENHGAVYTGNPVEKEGKIITANGPNAAEDFGNAIAENIIDK